MDLSTDGSLITSFREIALIILSDDRISRFAWVHQRFVQIYVLRDTGPTKCKNGVKMFFSQTVSVAVVFF